MALKEEIYYILSERLRAYIKANKRRLYGTFTRFGSLSGWSGRNNFYHWLRDGRPVPIKVLINLIPLYRDIGFAISDKEYEQLILTDVFYDIKKKAGPETIKPALSLLTADQKEDLMERMDKDDMDFIIKNFGDYYAYMTIPTHEGRATYFKSLFQMRSSILNLTK